MLLGVNEKSVQMKVSLKKSTPLKRIKNKKINKNQAFFSEKRQKLKMVTLSYICTSKKSLSLKRQWPQFCSTKKLSLDFSILVLAGNDGGGRNVIGWGKDTNKKWTLCLLFFVSQGSRPAIYSLVKAVWAWNSNVLTDRYCNSLSLFSREIIFPLLLCSSWNVVIMIILLFSKQWILSL